MAQSHDIDDVLSSVRRLVANDAPRPAPAPAKEAPALVLAPDARVQEPEDPFQMIRSLAQEERDGRDAEFLVDRVDSRLASITGDLVVDALVEASSWTAREDETAPVDYREDADYETEEEDAPASGPAPSGPTAQELGRAEPDGLDLSDISDGIARDDALRELIAETVRQELAGPLGERITRNVRKLVRRELRQLLSSGEFD